MATISLLRLFRDAKSSYVEAGGKKKKAGTAGKRTRNLIKATYAMPALTMALAAFALFGGSFLSEALALSLVACAVCLICGVALGISGFVGARTAADRSAAYTAAAGAAINLAGLLFVGLAVWFVSHLGCPAAPEPGPGPLFMQSHAERAGQACSEGGFPWK